MKTIELIGNKIEVVLLHTALIELLERINDENDKYEVGILVGDLIEQVEYIHAIWEDN
jgi:hypothetical protein